MMPRPALPPGTLLGRAIRDRRGPTTQAEAAAGLGIVSLTLSRIERGTHRPSYDTAVKLAAWLGWSVEQVMNAAAEPAPPSQQPS